MNNGQTMYGSGTRRLKMPICNRYVTTELSNDYILPDYQPEIRKVLSVTSEILPPAKYVGVSNAEFNGTVDYQVTYVGSDGELYSLPLSAEYTFGVPLEAGTNFDLSEGVVAVAQISGESLSHRVAGPRKITVKNRLRSRVSAFAEMVLEENVTGETNPLSIERLDGESSAVEIFSGLSDLIEVSDEFPVESENVRVVAADANVFISEVTTGNDLINVRGEVVLKMLLSDETTGKVFLVTRKLPFDKDIEIEGVTPDADGRVLGRMSNISINLDSGKIISDLSFILDAIAQRNITFQYTRDIYSTENESVATYKNYAVPVAVATANGHFSINERLSKTALGIPEAAIVINACARSVVDKVECGPDGFIITGQAIFLPYLLTGTEYSTVDVTVPFRYEMAGTCTDPVNYLVDVQPIDWRVRLDGDTLSIDAEYAASASFIGEETITTLASVNFGSPVKRTKGDIIITYPAPDETLWSIAKKYAVPTSGIVSDRPASDIPVPGRYLIINT